MKFIYGALGVIASGLLVQTAWSAESLAQRIEACAQQQDDIARLKCFDAEARSLRAAHATANTTGDRAPAGAVTERANAAAEREAAERATDGARVNRNAAARANLNSLAERNAAEHANAGGRSDGATAEQLRARPVAPHDNPTSGQPVTALVVAISKTPTLQRRIELDNGQVWQENEHDKGLLLAAGDNVQIQAGALRSFVLRAPSGAQTHVRRVR